MNLELVERIVAAVLYEGYMLYPYRPSSVKNQQRWTFGGIYPRAYSEAQRWQRSLDVHQTECVVVDARARRGWICACDSCTCSHARSANYAHPSPTSRPVSSRSFAPSRRSGSANACIRPGRKRSSARSHIDVELSRACANSHNEYRSRFRRHATSNRCVDRAATSSPCWCEPMKRSAERSKLRRHASAEAGVHAHGTRGEPDTVCRTEDASIRASATTR